MAKKQLKRRIKKALAEKDTPPPAPAPAPTTPPPTKDQASTPTLRQLLEEMEDPHRRRGAAGFLARGVRDGLIKMTGVDQILVKNALEEGLNDKSLRVKSAFLRSAAVFVGHDIRLAIALDNAIKLDDGKGTQENPEPPQIYVEGNAPCGW